MEYTKDYLIVPKCAKGSCTDKGHKLLDDKCMYHHKKDLVLSERTAEDDVFKSKTYLFSPRPYMLEVKQVKDLTTGRTFNLGVQK